MIKRLIKLYPYKWFLNYRGYFIYFGQKVFFPKRSSTFTATLHQGIYESDVLALIIDLCKPDTCFFDLGTNIGTISIPVLASKNKIKVVSFEASPNTLPYLQKTHAASSYKDRWTVIPKAVSNKNGTVSFSLADKKNGAFEGITDTNRVSMVSTVEVEATTVDLVWEEMGRPEVSIIKCDIEGADLLALEGTITCINASKPVILMEWNRINIKAFNFSSEDMFRFLNTIKYDLFSLPNIVPVRSASELNVHQVLSEMYLLKPTD